MSNDLLTYIMEPRHENHFDDLDNAIAWILVDWCHSSWEGWQWGGRGSLGHIGESNTNNKHGNPTGDSVSVESPAFQVIPSLC